MLNDKDKCKDKGCENLRCAGSAWCHKHGGMDFCQPAQHMEEATNLPRMPSGGEAVNIHTQRDDVGNTTTVDGKWLAQMLKEYETKTTLIEELRQSLEQAQQTNEHNYAEVLELRKRNDELAKRCIALEDTVIELERDEALNEAEDRFSRLSVMYTNLLLERY